MGVANNQGTNGPWFGPRDLVGDPGADAPTLVGQGGRGVMRASGGLESTVSGPFVGEFEDWGDGRAASRSPVAGSGSMGTGGRGVLDGAQAFSDIYGTTSAHVAGSAGSGSAAAAGVAGVQVAEGAAVAGGVAVGAMAGIGAGAAAGVAAAATGLAPSPMVRLAPLDQSAAARIERAIAKERGDEDDEPEQEQESLPGLARQPRQIVLPVEEPSYVLPDAELLRKSVPVAVTGQASERDTAAVLLHALSQFGVEARVIGMVVGPRVTRYELHLAPGTKVSKVTNLKDDLAYALASTEIRILAPIPGKSAVGVEVPNQRPDFVTLGDIYREFPKTAGPLMVRLGKDISGKAVYTDLTRLPHLLIAGTTGSGKSGCVNCLVSSIHRSRCVSS